MIIYGVALLSACLVAGLYIGEVLGKAIGVQANVGGVGIAMLLLILACNLPRFRSLTSGTSAGGITFWSAMYIPIVVAMAARQNVAGALDGGVLALVAGVAAVIVSFAFIPLISRIGNAPVAPATAEEPAADE
jgi:malonate transporter MadL subunit